MFVDFEHLIRIYGGLAVFLGAALEGEAAVTTGGYLAHRGLINPFTAALCAFAGSFVADQTVFFLARYHRDNRFIVRMRARPVFTRAIQVIERRPILFCSAFRFIYGMRTAGPVAIGISNVSMRLFVVMNALSAILWAAIFTFIGFRFGKAFEILVDRILPDRWVMGGAIVAALCIAAFFFCRRRKAARHSSTGNL